LTPAFALRRTLASGYGLGDFRHDLMAGAVVGVVALPLAMALAIGCGVPPQHGLYTAIVAGLVIALLGGSRVQVSGPTAAFVAILAPIAAHYGIAGLALASAMAGVILIGLALLRLGRLIEFVPNPVTAGFTAGIAVVIATLQLPDFLGLQPGPLPAEFSEKVGVIFGALSTTSLSSFGLGLGTLAILIFWPKVPGIGKRLPGPLVALTVATVAALLWTRLAPGVAFDTIASRFSYTGLDGLTHPGIPQLPPLPLLPWTLPGPGGQPLPFSFGLVRELLPSAFAIAMLGAIESLLSAVVADGMTRHRHDPNAELFGQGVGNVVAPFFGGFAATGAIARTATNVRAGARSPIAAVVHAVVVLASVLVLAPVLGLLPMAALAALLLHVAGRMSEAKHVLRTLRRAPRSDILVLLVCLFLTVVFDMVVAVSVGMVLASFMFMRRMAEVSTLSLVDQPDRAVGGSLPKGVVLYQIAGPLFFGAAQRAMSALHRIAPGVKTVILDLRAAPAIDETGLVALESTTDALADSGIFVVLAGVPDQPFRALIKAGWRHRRDEITLFRTFDDGVERARKSVGEAVRPV
jgi:SulP family sulfate permease